MQHQIHCIKVNGRFQDALCVLDACARFVCKYQPKIVFLYLAGNPNTGTHSGASKVRTIYFLVGRIAQSV
jgi:hypothetical protein